MGLVERFEWNQAVCRSSVESELTNNSAKRSGGAIRMQSGNMVIYKCEITNNREEQMGGGAIRVGSGNVSISECKLTNNRAKRSGRAIYVNLGNVSISDSTFSGNVSISENNGGNCSVVFWTMTLNYRLCIIVMYAPIYLRGMRSIVILHLNHMLNSKSRLLILSHPSGQ